MVRLGVEIQGSGKGTIQGFVADNDKFYTREEALIIAKENGQIKNGRIIGSLLTSEDLW